MIRKYGLLAGALNIGLYLSAYLINPEWFFSPALIGIGWVLIVAVMYRACREEKALVADYPFKAAFRTAFGVGALAIALFQLYFQLQVHVFDPGLIDLWVEVSNRSAEQAAQFYGKDPEDFRITREALAFNAGNALFNLAQFLLGAAAISALMALFMKSPTVRGE